LSGVSCKALRVVATPLPWQIVLPFTDKKWFAPLHEGLYMLTRCWKAGLGYQFVVAAAPGDPLMIPPTKRFGKDSRE